MKADSNTIQPTIKRTVYERMTDEGLTQQSLINELSAEVTELKAEVERMKAALEKYADKDRWAGEVADDAHESQVELVWCGGGRGYDIARIALSPDKL